ncbi:MAG: hypothetical protein ACUZ8H_12115 [Candidatus Anammoxibacter sp.]
MNIFRMLFLIIVVVMLSLILVWEQNNITRIGYRIASLDKRKIDLIEENRMLEHEVNKLITSERISKVIKSFNLNLVYAHESENGIEGKNRLYTQVNIADGSLLKEF